jgi:hypothetical protein
VLESSRGDRLAVLSQEFRGSPDAVPRAPPFSRHGNEEQESMQQITESSRKSKFERFVRSYGVVELALKLNIQESAIYHWLRGSTAPRPVHAGIIQRLALRRGQRLTLDQIYAHFLSLRAREVSPKQFAEASTARRAPRLDSQWT